MESKKEEKNSNNKNIENDPSKNQQDNKKKPEEKENNITDEEKLLLDLLKSSMSNETQDEKSNPDSSKNKDNSKNSSKNFFTNTESSFLSQAITKLQNGDDMDIMSELILLCEQLSLASDQIGDNPNMPKLLEEICKNLEKIYLPELIIYSLQCINYILDINPGLTSVLKRLNIIPKIISIISAMEDTQCLESIVSVFEKISFENSLLLLENNVFLNMLNVIDFLATPQRKSIMKICSNISTNIITYKQFDLYINPAMENLYYLSKYSDDNMYITEKAIGIYFNILYNLKQGSYFNNNPDLENSIHKYNFMENYCEILKKYFFEDNKKINADLIRKILKIIYMIFNVSKKETDRLLSLNILESKPQILCWFHCRQGLS